MLKYDAAAGPNVWEYYFERVSSYRGGNASLDGRPVRLLAVSDEDARRHAIWSDKDAVTSYFEFNRYDAQLHAVMRLIGVSPLSGLQPTGVEQVIDVMGRRVVNCVDLAPWPKGPIAGFLANAPGPPGGDKDMNPGGGLPPGPGTTWPSLCASARWVIIERISGGTLVSPCTLISDNSGRRAQLPSPASQVVWMYTPPASALSEGRGGADDGLPEPASW